MSRSLHSARSLGVLIPAVVSASVLCLGMAFTTQWRTHSAEATVVAGLSIQEEKESARPESTMATPYVFGASSCRNCHSTPSQDSELCRLIEFNYWDRLDPHKLALDWGTRNDETSHRTVAAKRAWDIGKRLGIEDVTNDDRCLGCHSIVSPPQVPRQQFVATSEGVTCVACHGPFQQWVLLHQLLADPEWRGLSRGQKWEKAGMVDLWDPVVRAEACVSCHIGDPDPSTHRQITHTMYAAGHPPLPGFELSSFTFEEPRHWQLLREKSPKVQKELGFNPDRLEETEQVLAGGLVAFRRTLELFESQAVDPSGYPEFARFDCVACHHELDAPGATGTNWRQLRKPVGAPGRPVEAAWPIVLAALAVDTLPDSEDKLSALDLRTPLEQFHRALTSRPFGDQEATARAARSLIDQINPLIESFRSQSAVGAPPSANRVNPSTAGRILRRLAEIGSTEILDYDTARQIGWAYRAIHSELLAIALMLNEPPSDSTLASIQANAPQALPLIAKLDQLLVLSLRGSDPSGPLPETPVQRPLMDAYLKDRLDRAHGYDPGPVRDAFAGLASLLPPGP